MLRRAATRAGSTAMVEACLRGGGLRFLRPRRQPKLVARPRCAHVVAPLTASSPAHPFCFSSGPDVLTSVDETVCHRSRLGDSQLVQRGRGGGSRSRQPPGQVRRLNPSRLALASDSAPALRSAYPTRPRSNAISSSVCRPSCAIWLRVAGRPRAHPGDACDDRDRPASNQRQSPSAPSFKAALTWLAYLQVSAAVAAGTNDRERRSATLRMPAEGEQGGQAAWP